MKVLTTVVIIGLLFLKESDAFFCLTTNFNVLGEQCICRGGELRCFKPNYNNYGRPGYYPGSYGPYPNYPPFPPYGGNRFDYPDFGRY